MQEREYVTDRVKEYMINLKMLNDNSNGVIKVENNFSGKYLLNI